MLSSKAGGNCDSVINGNKRDSMQSEHRCRKIYCTCYSKIFVPWSREGVEMSLANKKVKRAWLDQGTEIFLTLLTLQESKKEL